MPISMAQLGKFYASTLDLFTETNNLASIFLTSLHIIVVNGLKTLMFFV